MTSDRLATDLRAILARDPSRFLPMAQLTLRFEDGVGPHLGEAVLGAIEAYFDFSGEVPPYLFGIHPKPGGGVGRVAKPKDLRTAKGRAFLRDRLAEIPRLPEDALDMVAKDGDPELAALPDRTALRVALGAMEDPWLPGGLLAFAFPLSDLEGAERRAAWLSLGDRLHAALRGSVATLVPSLWATPRTLLPGSSHELYQDELVAICGRHPQVDVPLLYGGNSDIYPASLSPGLTRGIVGVPWVCWREGRRLSVEADPPLSMDEDRFARYRAAKEALVAVATTEEPTWLARAFFGRFGHSSYASAEAEIAADWRREEAERRAKEKLTSRLWTLRDDDPAAAVKVAEEALGQWPELVLGSALYAVQRLLAAKAIEAERARWWAEKLAPELPDRDAHAGAAAIWVALGDPERALGCVERALAHNRGGSQFDTWLRKDPSMGKLRKDPRFLALFGK